MNLEQIQHQPFRGNFPNCPEIILNSPSSPSYHSSSEEDSNRVTSINEDIRIDSSCERANDVNIDKDIIAYDNDILYEREHCVCQYNTHSKSSSDECMVELNNGANRNGAIKNNFSIDNSLEYSTGNLINNKSNTVCKCEESRPRLYHKNCNQFIIESSF